VCVGIFIILSYGWWLIWYMGYEHFRGQCTVYTSRAESERDTVCSFDTYSHIPVYTVMTQRTQYESSVPQILMPSQITAHILRPHGDKFLMRLISGAYFHFLSHKYFEKVPQHKGISGITYLSCMI
jgi:hypothetical protein